MEASSFGCPLAEGGRRILPGLNRRSSRQDPSRLSPATFRVASIGGTTARTTSAMRRHGRLHAGSATPPHSSRRMRHDAGGSSMRIRGMRDDESSISATGGSDLPPSGVPLLGPHPTRCHGAKWVHVFGIYWRGRLGCWGTDPRDRAAERPEIAGFRLTRELQQMECPRTFYTDLNGLWLLSECHEVKPETESKPRSC
jgi:hypothetical protein